MKNYDRKEHWENIYLTKELEDVSWYQPTPQTSLNFIADLGLPKVAKIIDIGGGDSFLVDHLLDLGFLDITVLDISKTAIERAKLRLGERGNKVRWIIADVTNYKTTEKYDLWHDRAAFHFLSEEADILNYVETAHKYLCKNGVVVIGAFSEHGPTRCSGIRIKQYSESSLTNRFENKFSKLKCLMIDHRTPFDTLQNFVFCSFKKITNSSMY